MHSRCDEGGEIVCTQYVVFYEPAMLSVQTSQAEVQNRLV